MRRSSTTAGACGAGCGRWLRPRARPACGLAAADLAAWPACGASGAHRRAHHVWGGPRSRAWVLPARSAMICANGMPPGSARNGYAVRAGSPSVEEPKTAPADLASRSPPRGPRATPCRMAARTDGFARQSHSYRQPAAPRQATTRISAGKCAPPPTSPQRHDRPTQVIGNQFKQVHKWQICVQFRHRRPGTWARKYSAGRNRSKEPGDTR